MIRIYKQGVTAVVQRTTGDDTRRKFIPLRHGTFSPGATATDPLTVTDEFTGNSWSFQFSELRTESDGEFATKDLAETYLAGFLGGFNIPQGGGGGDFDPAEHSVTEFQDVSSSGSGQIITTAERTKLSTTEIFTNSEKTKLSQIDQHGIISELGFALGNQVQNVFQLVGNHNVQFNAINANNWANVAVTANRSNGSGGTITESITLNTFNINPGGISTANFTFTENDANLLAAGVGPINFVGVAADSQANPVGTIHIGQINVIPVERQIKDFVIPLTGITNSQSVTFTPGQNSIPQRTVIVDVTDLPPETDTSYFDMKLGSTNGGNEFTEIKKLSLAEIPNTSNVEQGATFEINAPGGGINRVLVSWIPDGTGGTQIRVLVPLSFPENSVTLFIETISQTRGLMDTWYLNRSGGIAVNVYDIVPRIGYNGKIIGIAAKTRSGNITYNILKNGQPISQTALVANNSNVINNTVDSDFVNGDLFQLAVLTEPTTAQDLFLSVEVRRPIE